MSDSINENLSENLTNLRLLTQNDIDVFSKYGITSLEQLLGATKGLSNTKLFDNIENGELLLIRFKQLAGESEIKKYKEFDTYHPTGLILDNNDETPR